MKTISGNPYIKKENGKIFFDSVPLNNLLEEHGTPIMVFLENRLRDNLKTFQDVFKSVFKEKHFHGFYSFKANYLLEICKIVCSEKLGAEIIGLPELKLALKIGFPTKKIIVGGPFLPKELIEKSVECEVKEIIVYNLNDLSPINSTAQKFGRIQDICLRVNSQKYDSRLGINFNEKNLSILKNLSEKCKNINITSILSHYSSQMNNMEQFRQNIRAIAKNLNDLAKIDIKCEKINLGGGFPEATVMPKNQLKSIAVNMKTEIEELGIDYKQIYFEPGRYFVGDTGLFLAEIIKVSERWIFLNIGNHICPKFARCSLRFYNTSQINEPHKFKTSIAGIVPTDQDVLAKNYFFNENLIEGDNVLITNVGAYTLTFSNRFPYALPKIFLVKNSNVKQIFDPSTDRDISIN